MSIPSIDEKLQELENSIQSKGQTQHSNIDELKQSIIKIESTIKEEFKKNPKEVKEIMDELDSCKDNVLIKLNLSKQNDISKESKTKIEYFKESLANLKKRCSNANK